MAQTSTNTQIINRYKNYQINAKRKSWLMVAPKLMKNSKSVWHLSGTFHTNFGFPVENLCFLISVKWFLDKLRKYCHNFPRPETLLKRDSDAGVSCKFCEISKNTFFIEHVRVTASRLSLVASKVFFSNCFEEILW